MMLKINTNFRQYKIPLILGVIGISGMFLFSYLTFIPAQSFATDSDTDQRTLMNIKYMQQMSDQICTNTKEGKTKQLIDIRDGKSYWVTKLKDGNCWMTQNLDLDLSTGKTLTPADSDVTNEWTPTTDTKVGNIKSGWSGTHTAIQSWDPGDYYYALDANWTKCGVDEIENLRVCSTWTTSVPNPEGQHYHAGNYYSWNAATAGTGESETSGEAADSVCQKGWHLPSGDISKQDSFAALTNQYNLMLSGTNSIRNAPLYFLPGGFLSTSGVGYSGSDGDYWSSTPSAKSNEAYRMYFDKNGIAPSASYQRYLGMPVRCVSPSLTINPEGNDNTDESLWPDPNYPDDPDLPPTVLPDSATSNVAITVSPVISIDATSGMSSEVDFTTVAHGDITATISSNQKYQVLLSTNQSTLEQSPIVPNHNIPMITTDTTITPGTRAWGIKKTNSALAGGTLGDTTANTLFSPIGIGNNKVLFYESLGAESKTITFPVAISVDSTLPSGTYATEVTITATAN